MGWSIEGTVEEWVEQFGASISFDHQLAKFDLMGSLAHVQMLGQTGILSLEEAGRSKMVCKALLRDLEAGELHFDIANEDIHMNMEVLLTEKIGPLAGNYTRLVLGMTKSQRICTISKGAAWPCLG